MPLPKRPSSYILALLLILLISMVGWMYKLVSMPELAQLAAKKAKEAEAKPMPDAPALPSVTSRPAPIIIDPALEERANQLHAPDSSPERDLEIVAEFIQTYGKALGGNPIGDNADITAALTGTEGHKGRVFPPAHRSIRNGQLIDRWGVPYWFHPNSGNQMEIRSAGPDKQLFSPDDIVLNPSPSGLGVTPPADSQSGN